VKHFFLAGIFLLFGCAETPRKSEAPLPNNYDELAILATESRKANISRHKPWEERNIRSFVLAGRGCAGIIKSEVEFVAVVGADGKIGRIEFPVLNDDALCVKRDMLRLRVKAPPYSPLLVKMRLVPPKKLAEVETAAEIQWDRSLIRKMALAVASKDAELFGRKLHLKEHIKKVGDVPPKFSAYEWRKNSRKMYECIFEGISEKHTFLEYTESTREILVPRLNEAYAGGNCKPEGIVWEKMQNIEF